MRILMVGCGAVGQVLALHLVKSGMELAFYARPESAAKLRKAQDEGGLILSKVTHLHNRERVQRLRHYHVVEDTAGSLAFAPDQIWFTTPSPVYHSVWFRSFTEQVPADRVVCFAPEGRRPDTLPEGQERDRFVFGGVTFVAWQGDLGAGAGLPDGVNYWLPPGLRIPLVGAAAACAEVAETLDAAGLRAVLQKPGSAQVQAAVTGVMTAFVGGLELADWSLRSYRRSRWRSLSAHAARQAALSQFPDAGSLIKMLLRLSLSPLSFALATLLLPIILPVDAEAYLRFHFLKTRDQTLALLDLFAEDARRRGRPDSEIRALRAALHDVPSAG